MRKGSLRLLAFFHCLSWLLTVQRFHSQWRCAESKKAHRPRFLSKASVRHAEEHISEEMGCDHAHIGTPIVCQGISFGLGKHDTRSALACKKAAFRYEEKAQ